MSPRQGVARVNRDWVRLGWDRLLNSSGMWLCVDGSRHKESQKNYLGLPDGEHEDTMVLRNVGNNTPNNIASRPRLESSATSLRENQISRSLRTMDGIHGFTPFSALYMEMRLFGVLPGWTLFWLPHWKQWPSRRASSLQSLATNYVALYRAVGTATDPMWMGGWGDLDHCPRSKCLLEQHLRHVFAPTRG